MPVGQFKTQPISHSAEIELQPIPVDEGVTPVSHKRPIGEAVAAAEQDAERPQSEQGVPLETKPIAEMPTIRQSNRPRWRPYR